MMIFRINKKIKKIILSILLILFIFSLSPKTTKAQWPVIDEANLFVNSMNGASLDILVSYGSAQQIKSYALDSIAWMVAKMLLQMMTAQVVSWINSGFQGSPAFVQNPSAFFIDVADQVTGEFLQGSLLEELCSPFSIDLRIALNFKFHPYTPKRYSCTLGKIIQNTVNAAKNASINGFTAGDFKQGGWPAFVTMTTEPQNNIFGAYIQADTELSLNIASAQDQKRDELNQGKGFLSWEKCEPKTQFDEVTLKEEPVPGTKGDCKIMTPGSTISDALSKHLGSGVDTAVVADSINEIVGALLSQLVQMVLTKGLGGMSSGGSGYQGYSGSYVNQMRDDASPGGKSFESVVGRQNSALNSVTAPITQYKDNKVSSFNLYRNLEDKYSDAKSCYIEKKDNAISPIVVAGYQDQIAQIENIISTSISATTTRLANEIDRADAMLRQYDTTRDTTNSSLNIDDLNTSVDNISSISSGYQSISTMEVNDSRHELNDIRSITSSLMSDAQMRLNQCQIPI